MLRNLAVFSCLALTSLTACLPLPETATTATQPPAENRNVPFEIVASGGYLGTPQKSLVVIQSDTELAAALVGTNISTLPSVDFSNHTLIGAFMSLTSGCEYATITAITDDTDRLTVNARKVSRIAPNELNPPACLAPTLDGGFVFATIAKNFKPVTLVTHDSLQFNVVAKGIYPYMQAPQKPTLVIQTSNELDAALVGVDLGSVLPLRVDFSTQTLIGVFVANISACAETVVTTITDDGVDITVNATHVVHLVPCITAAVGGSYVFVTLPKTTKHVNFVITKSTPGTTPRDVPFEKVSNGHYQGTVQKQLLVIQSSSELTAALTGITLNGAPPSANFSSQTLIGVFIRGLNPGCGDVAITTITDDGNQLITNANITNLSGPCLPLPADGGYQFVSIAKTMLPITLMTVTSNNLRFDIQSNGTYIGTPKQQYMVIQSSTEYDQVLADVSLSSVMNGQFLDIDYSTRTLIGVFVAHGSVCEQTTVTHISDDGAALTVNAIHVSHPNRICIALAVSGSYMLVTIPKTAKPVSFVVTDVVVTQ